MPLNLIDEKTAITSASIYWLRLNQLSMNSLRGRCICSDHVVCVAINQFESMSPYKSINRPWIQCVIAVKIKFVSVSHESFAASSVHKCQENMEFFRVHITSTNNEFCKMILKLITLYLNLIITTHTKLSIYAL